MNPPSKVTHTTVVSFLQTTIGSYLISPSFSKLGQEVRLAKLHQDLASAQAEESSAKALNETQTINIKSITVKLAQAESRVDQLTRELKLERSAHDNTRKELLIVETKPASTADEKRANEGQQVEETPKAMDGSMDSGPLDTHTRTNHTSKVGSSAQPSDSEIENVKAMLKKESEVQLSQQKDRYEKELTEAKAVTQKTMVAMKALKEKQTQIMTQLQNEMLAEESLHETLTAKETEIAALIERLSKTEIRVQSLEKELRIAQEAAKTGVEEKGVDLGKFDPKHWEEKEDKDKSEAGQDRSEIEDYRICIQQHKSQIESLEEEVKAKESYAEAEISKQKQKIAALEADVVKLEKQMDKEATLASKLLTQHNEMISNLEATVRQETKRADAASEQLTEILHSTTVHATPTSVEELPESFFSPNTVKEKSMLEALERVIDQGSKARPRIVTHCD